MAEASCPYKPDFDERKFREAVVYIAEQSERDEHFGATKLNKILYYADFAAYRTLGCPITGATYRRLAQGPAPVQMVDQRRTLIDAGDVTVEPRPYFTGIQHRYIAKRSPEKDILNSAEVSILDRVIKGLWHMTARQASDFSHNEWGWKLAQDLEEIPYPSAWLSAEPVDDWVVEYGIDIAREHGLV